MATPPVVAWVNDGWGKREAPRGRRKWNRGDHSARSTWGTTRGAAGIPDALSGIVLPRGCFVFQKSAPPKSPVFTASCCEI